MTTMQEMRALVEADRARTQERLAALEGVLTALEAVEALVAAVPDTPAKAPRATKAPRTSLPKPKVQIQAADKPATTRGAVGRYRVEILKFLWSFTLDPHYSADGAVIRRTVAKACGVNPTKDPSFAGDIGNALQTLKRAGKVERSGTMWALVSKPGERS